MKDCISIDFDSKAGKLEFLMSDPIAYFFNRQNVTIFERNCEATKNVDQSFSSAVHRHRRRYLLYRSCQNKVIKF